MGVGGIIAAICTLRNIEQQTKAAKDATAVAKASMDALISKERARLRVDRPSNTLDFLQPGYVREEKVLWSPYMGDEQAIEISVFNRGATTARDVKASFGISIDPVSVESASGPRETTKVDIGDLASGNTPFRHSIALYGGIKQEDLEAIHNQKAVLRVFGEISYTDAYEPLKPRETAFSFEWKSDLEWYEVKV